MSDEFQFLAKSLISPGTVSTPVTPHDSNAIDPVMRALYVGTGGTIVGRLQGDSADRTFKNIADGSVIPFRFTLIKTSGAGTTATDMVAIY